MTLAEIEALAAAGESETLELKASTGERVAGAMTVCAMLNHRGGTVLFGVDPNRTVRGQSVSDRTIEQLSAALSEIDPPAFPAIDQVAVRGELMVVVVTVAVGQHQPYTHRGRALRRVGNTNRSMPREECNRVLLDRLHGQYRWENEPVGDWTVDDVDRTEVVRTLDEAIRRRRARNASSARICRSLDVFHQTDSSERMIHSTLLRLCARRLRTLSATGTTPSAEDRWRPRSTTTAWK